MKHILVGTDGTDHSDTAVQFAAQMAKVFGAKLTIALVNVARGGARGALIPTHDVGEASRIVTEAAEQARRSGLGVVETAILTSREAAAALVTYAEENAVDHIVTGTGDKHGVSRLVLGSVAADVASRAHCGVTIARS